MRLRALPDGDNSFVAPIGTEPRGRWCRIALSFVPPFRPRIAILRGETESGAVIADTYHLSLSLIARWIGRSSVLAYIPATAAAIRVEVFGFSTPTDGFDLAISPMPQWLAGIRIACRHPLRILAALAGGSRGLARRVRTTMVVAATGQMPESYDFWALAFDAWPESRIARLLGSRFRDSWPSVAALVCGAPGSAAMAATLLSLERQIVPLSGAIAEAEYVAVIQAGEIVPPHAMALFADWIAASGRPDAVYADEDAIDATGQRHSPIFKPEPNRTLMLSGTLAGGVWLIRRRCLPASMEAEHPWAAPVRLDAWLRLYEHDRARNTCRMPYIATHRRDDCDREPAGVMAETVEAHLQRMSVSAEVTHTWPIIVRPAMPAGSEPHITFVVPSACRSSHVVKCLTAIATRTSYPRFDMIVVLSQSAPADAQQQQTIAALRADPRIEVLFHPITGSFNYAAANNFGVERAVGPLVCLLNDDVEPIDGDWLANMAGHMTDPAVGAVGAKLYYHNDQVQHGGVILGLSGLCDHANRFLPRGAPGYVWRGILDQQVSAVTGACILTERALYRSVGDMDERYASAFNDIDLCLKIGEAGRSVVFCARSELYHYESLSFVQHYTEAESARWASDVAAMRARWPDILADDPFHNPNLSKVRGHEWSPAFPPFAEFPSAMRR